MKILDVFSWVSAKELSIEQIEDMFFKLCKGTVIDSYMVEYQLPNNADRNIVECKNDLEREGKKVAYIMRKEFIVALVGYKS